MKDNPIFGFLGRKSRPKPPGEGELPPVEEGGRGLSVEGAIFEHLRDCGGEVDFRYLEDMLAAGADVDYTVDGKTPLVLALEKKLPYGVIAFLAGAGASIDKPTAMGRTPLLWAAYYGADPRVLYLMVKAGSAPEAVDDYGWNALAYAAASKYSGNPGRVIRYLASVGTSPDSADKGGNTPLMVAARYNQDLRVLRALLHVGASAGVADATGLTALEIARSPDRRSQRQPDPAFIDMLEKAGASSDPSSARAAYRPKLVLKALQGVHKGADFALPSGGLVIGRSAGAGVRLDDPMVSSRSVQVIPLEDCRASVTDLGSKVPIVKFDPLGGHDVLGTDILECGDSISPNAGADLFRLEERV